MKALEKYIPKVSEDAVGALVAEFSKGDAHAFAPGQAYNMASTTEMKAEASHNNFDTILVLDFGSQTRHLILRGLRALKVYAEMLPCTTKLADLPFKPKGIVLSEGPSSSTTRARPTLTLPSSILVSRFWAFATVARSLLRESTPRTSSVAQPESTATPMLPSTTQVISDFIKKEIICVKNLVSDRAQVIGALSGGVDSTVAAKLMKEAVDDCFHAIMVENGVIRLNECEAESFPSRLKGVTEPEKKRKIIGGTFIDLFEKEALRIEKEAENTPNAGAVE
ncbi:hypothetical protein LY76DRAFT_640668 [Colletotrichum caudatum]|nr:hypothetical protein LY76DRAFT_640668 [Colletotrichum caudatum]